VLSACGRREPSLLGATNGPPVDCPRCIDVRLGPELVAAMDALKERDGILPSEQVRRALTMWLESKGMLKPPTISRRNRS